MSESFAELFEESLETIEMAPGSIVTGTVVEIDSDWVVVHAGLKSEGVIPLHEFGEHADIDIGDEIEVLLDEIEDETGMIRLSKRKADRIKGWERVVKTYVEGDDVLQLETNLVALGFDPDGEVVVDDVFVSDAAVAEAESLADAANKPVDDAVKAALDEMLGLNEPEATPEAEGETTVQ